MIQTVLLRFLTPASNPAANAPARLPGAYPSSVTSETETGTYYTASEYTAALEHRSECGPIVVRPWEDFLTNGEIEGLLQSNPLLKAFSRNLPPTGQDELIGGQASGESFFKLWAAQVNLINIVIYQCACEVQATDNPTFVAIGDGQTATQKAHQNDTDAIVYAAYRVPERNSHTLNTVENRIPGESKMFRKFRHSMLSPDGQDRGADTDGAAQQVLARIHESMNQLDARYGYIINEKELIMFRCTGRGQLDISPSVRHDVQANVEHGIWNSKIVLFYFHWFVANDDALWRLGSTNP